MSSEQIPIEIGHIISQLNKLLIHPIPIEQVYLSQINKLPGEHTGPVLIYGSLL